MQMGGPDLAISGRNVGRQAGVAASAATRKFSMLFVSSVLRDIQYLEGVLSWLMAINED